MPEEIQTINQEPENNLPETTDPPTQAEISEPTITETPKEETQPIETPQTIKPAEEISAPVENIEQPQTEPIAPTEPITPEPETTPPPPQPQTIEKIVYRQDPNIIKNLLNKARATIQQRKRAKLDKIMTLFEAKPQIVSKDVQKLLHARKRTTTNYLNQLEAENKITQIGNKGKGVSYIKKQ
jgi:hypothetical protein